MLAEQTRELGVFEFFTELIGLDNIHAGSKKHLAVEWKGKHSDARVLFIGDTDHDYDVACAMGADCILVAQGHQSYGHLREICTTTVKSLNDILDKC